MPLPPTNIRFRKIDATNCDTHHFFEEEDLWLFLYEKTSQRDYTFSDVNNLISNLKKPVASSEHVLRYKEQAIAACADALRHAINADWLAMGTLVPVPPSKAPTDQLYDNRMERICRLIGPEVDVRNLVAQRESMVATHERAEGHRITRDELAQNYIIDNELCEPQPTYIAIVDDMLTSGTHYRAMKDILSARFPEAKFVGMFIARRIFPED